VSERQPSPAESRRGNPDRVAAFTDGVFAIIITILVLEISVPPQLSDQSLQEAIAETGPELTAWVISFLLTGMYWVWHRDLFHQIRMVNRDVVWLNLLFLLPASLIPFGASVLNEYPREAIALRLFGVVIGTVAVMRFVLYAYLTSHPSLLWDAPSRRRRRLGGVLALAPTVVYAIAIAVAGAVPVLSLALYLAMPLLYFLLISVLRRHPSTRAEAEDFG
jgi:uncharacterized membrane protein